MNLKAKVSRYNISGLAALLAAESTPLTKQKGEADTEFVKRILCAYFDSLPYAQKIEMEIAGICSKDRNGNSR